MSRNNYHKQIAKERKMKASGSLPLGVELVTHRNPKENSRPKHKPKTLRKVIKSEKIKSSISKKKK